MAAQIANSYFKQMAQPYVEQEDLLYNEAKIEALNKQMEDLKLNPPMPEPTPEPTPSPVMVEPSQPSSKQESSADVPMTNGSPEIKDDPIEPASSDNNKITINPIYGNETPIVSDTPPEEGDAPMPDSITPSQDDQDNETLISVPLPADGNDSDLKILIPNIPRSPTPEKESDTKISLNLMGGQINLD